MGAMETMMIDVAYAQVGRTLGFPTHAYMACSDAKLPDYQAGMETGMGALMAAAGGVNVVSGPGFLNYENTQSPEKLVLDNDACGMAFRLMRGVQVHADPDPLELIRRHAVEGRFLADRSTQRMHRKELSPAGRCVDRTSVAAWREKGSPTARDAALKEVERLYSEEAETLDEDRFQALRDILLQAARSLGEEVYSQIQVVAS
jgi:trimethylamine--corrinoid protein Co-methyltransferase